MRTTSSSVVGMSIGWGGVQRLMKRWEIGVYTISGFGFDGEPCLRPCARGLGGVRLVIGLEHYSLGLLLAVL